MLPLAIWQAGARSQRPRRHPARSSALREGRVVRDPLREFFVLRHSRTLSCSLRGVALGIVHAGSGRSDPNFANSSRQNVAGRLSWQQSAAKQNDLGKRRGQKRERSHQKVAGKTNDLGCLTGASVLTREATFCQGPSGSLAASVIEAQAPSGEKKDEKERREEIVVECGNKGRKPTSKEIGLRSGANANDAVE